MMMVRGNVAAMEDVEPDAGEVNTAAIKDVEPKTVSVPRDGARPPCWEGPTQGRGGNGAPFRLLKFAFHHLPNIFFAVFSKVRGAMGVYVAPSLPVLLKVNAAAIKDVEPKIVPVPLVQGNSGAGIDGSPPVPSLQVVVDQDQNQNSHDHIFIPIQETPPAAATGAVGDQEIQKEGALKIGLGTIAISASGIITIGIATHQISEGHRLGLKICAIPLGASFLLSSCLIGLASFPGRIPNWSKIVKTFKWMTLGVLVLAILGLGVGLYFVF